MDADGDVMRTGVRWSAIAVALLSIVAFSGITQASHQPTWYGTLEVGKMPGTPNHMCDPLEKCSELRGLTVQDYDVSSAMDGQDEPVDYVLKDLTSWAPLTVWRLCKYDGQGDLIECDEEGPHWYLWGEVPPETDTLRIILKQNAGVTYSLRLAT